MRACSRVVTLLIVPPRNKPEAGGDTSSRLWSATGVNPRSTLTIGRKTRREKHAYLTSQLTCMLPSKLAYMRAANRWRARPTEPSLAATDSSGSTCRASPSRDATAASSSGGPPQLCPHALRSAGAPGSRPVARKRPLLSERAPRRRRPSRASHGAVLAEREVLADRCCEPCCSGGGTRRSSFGVPPGSALPPTRTPSGVVVRGRSVCSLPCRARPAPQPAPHARLEGERGRSRRSTSEVLRREGRPRRSASEVWVRRDYASARSSRACRSYRSNAARRHQLRFPTRRGSVHARINA
jgi:hypothetical protein